MQLGTFALRCNCIGVQLSDTCADYIHGEEMQVMIVMVVEGEETWSVELVAPLHFARYRHVSHVRGAKKASARSQEKHTHRV